MIPKYHVEFAIEYGGHREAHARDFQTDDPVACEEFLLSLLERGLRIVAIRHEGVDLSQREFDALVKRAATAPQFSFTGGIARSPDGTFHTVALGSPPNWALPLTS